MLTCDRYNVVLIFLQQFDHSPLPAYEPAFDWENERSMIFGQRIPETPVTQYGNNKNYIQNSIFHLTILLFLQV